MAHFFVSLPKITLTVQKVRPEVFYLRASNRIHFSEFCN